MSGVGDGGGAAGGGAGRDPREALLGVYRPAGPLFVAGEGAELVADDGRRFLDFTSGIAVNSLGHGSPVVAAAAQTALATGLVHTSNLFRTEPAERLAARLAALSGLPRVFFCNSGAEGVEGAIKFARRWAREAGGPEKHRIVALRGSFHGRLFGSLAVTDRPAYQEPFRPLMPGVDFVDPGVDFVDSGVDFVDSGLDRALDPERTAALIAEPIQGEGGVRVLPHEMVQRMRTLTRERGIALILDEVQCGLGRTGELFPHQAAGIEPDIVVLAKPLAGGLPMGAVLLSDDVAAAVRPGDHATTFGGGPLVAAVALAVLEHVADPAFLAGVRERGALLTELLEALRRRHPERVLEIRGKALMRGVRVQGEAAPVVDRAREAGLLLVAAGPDVIRLLPPLNVDEADLRRGIGLLEASLA